MPLAISLPDDAPVRERYFDLIMERLETYCGEPVGEHLFYALRIAFENGGCYLPTGREQNVLINLRKSSAAKAGLQSRFGKEETFNSRLHYPLQQIRKCES